MVNHELRTPLTSIITLAQIALESGGADAEERRSWEEVRKSSSVLLGMINDMLDIARSDAGAMAVSMELMDLGDIVASAQGTIGPLAVGARVTLTTTVAPDVPLVSGDYEKMLRILENLGSNAVKFTPAGGTVAITAMREEATGDVLVTVSDDGIGIAPGEPGAHLRAVLPGGQLRDAHLQRQRTGSGPRARVRRGPGVYGDGGKRAGGVEARSPCAFPSRPW